MGAPRDAARHRDFGAACGSPASAQLRPLGDSSARARRRQRLEKGERRDGGGALRARVLAEEDVEGRGGEREEREVRGRGEGEILDCTGDDTETSSDETRVFSTECSFLILTKIIILVGITILTEVVVFKH